MPRFTISHHTGAKEADHYDLLLERPPALRTWRIQTPAFLSPQPARPIPDHREIYLDYEGDIPGGRGRIKIWDTGVYTIDEWQEHRIQAALTGRQLKARLVLECKRPPDAKGEPHWTIVDAAIGLRRAAAAFLRGAPLDDAPTEELRPLRTALAREEQRILALAEQFARGGAVEWSHAETDAELSRRIQSEKSRWQHPWLAAANEYADRVAELASQLRERRPDGLL